MEQDESGMNGLCEVSRPGWSQGPVGTCGMTLSDTALIKGIK